MKVKELIEILLTFDQELDIVVDGYECGVTEEISIKYAQVVCNINYEWYNGEHDVDSEFYQNTKSDEPRKKVIYISRYV